MPDPGRILSDQRAYVSEEYRLVFRALILQVAVALGLALITHWVLGRYGGASIRQRSAWSTVFHHHVPAGSQPHARVRLTNGSTYMGQVTDFNADLKRGDRELVLGPPLYSAPAGKKLTDLPSEWTRVVVAADQIAAMSVQYRPKTRKTEPAKRWWNRNQAVTTQEEPLAAGDGTATDG